MTPAQLFAVIAQLSGVLFGFTSMLAMGLSLSMAHILQPLKNLRLVFLALLPTARRMGARQQAALEPAGETD